MSYKVDRLLRRRSYRPRWARIINALRTTRSTTSSRDYFLAAAAGELAAVAATSSIPKVQ